MTNDELYEELKGIKEQEGYDTLIQGVCKDCGNGTLNNATNPAFAFSEGTDMDILYCLRCNSMHIDIL